MATKIYCAAVDCAFCNENGRCTAKEVCLSWNSVVTMNDGRQTFNTCRTFQKSERAAEIEKAFKETVERMQKDAKYKHLCEKKVK